MSSIHRYYVGIVSGVLLGTGLSPSAYAQCGECLQWSSQSSTPDQLAWGAYDELNGRLFAVHLTSGRVYMETTGGWIDKLVNVLAFGPIDARQQLVYSPSQQGIFNYVVGVMQKVSYVPSSGEVVVVDQVGNPVGLFGSAVSHFEPRGSLLIFGGYPFKPQEVRNTLVEFDPALQTYTPLLTAQSPTPRSHSAIGYDALRQRVVLFGGTENRLSNVGLDDTWEYDGDNWIPMTPADGIKPTARYLGNMAFDSSRGVMILVSGVNESGVLRDTWEWDGVRWRQRHAGTAHSLGAASRSLAFVKHEGTFRHFDGGVFTHTLAGVGIGPPMINPPDEPILQGLPGSSVLLSVSATADPPTEPLEYQWRHNGVSIPSATAPNYRLGPLTKASEGEYDCIVRYATGLDYDCGHSVSDPIYVEVLTPSCQTLDVNGDGAVNLFDFSIFQQQFGDPCP